MTRVSNRICNDPCALCSAVVAMITSTTQKEFGELYHVKLSQLEANPQARKARMAALEKELNDEVPVGPYPYYFYDSRLCKILLYEGRFAVRPC